MQDGETTVAWILFWLFALITTVSTFLIVDHHRSRRWAVLLTAGVAVFFLLLFVALVALLRSLGL